MSVWESAVIIFFFPQRYHVQLVRTIVQRLNVRFKQQNNFTSFKFCQKTQEFSSQPTHDDDGKGSQNCSRRKPFDIHVITTVAIR